MTSNGTYQDFYDSYLRQRALGIYDRAQADLEQAILSCPLWMIQTHERELQDLKRKSATGLKRVLMAVGL